MSKAHEVRVDHGKYTFVIEDGYRVSVERGGERWVHFVEGSKAVHSMMCELDAARVVLAAALQLAGRGEAPMALLDALQAHEALVNDREPPSTWTGRAPRKP